MMNELFDNLNNTFSNNVRFGIMTLLMTGDWIEFKQLKQDLSLTDGNLASHISALEKYNYIDIKKEFLANKPRTLYSASFDGRRAFRKHVQTLSKLIEHSN